jgi:transcriptional regulator with XRE-family HTH domain
MTELKRYDGSEEFSKLLKMLPTIPSNTEIVEKTGVSKSSVSRIMNGISPPSRNFVEKFKKGFNIPDPVSYSIQGTKKPPSQENGLKDKLIAILESSIKRVEADLERVLEENERLRNSKAN